MKFAVNKLTNKESCKEIKTYEVPHINNYDRNYT